MIAGATTTQWQVSTYNVGDDIVERTRFDMTLDNETYAVEIEQLNDSITANVRNVKDPDDDEYGFYQDDEFLGTVHELVSAIAQAYDDCNENRA